MTNRFEQARKDDRFRKEKLLLLQERIGYRFADLSLLDAAMTHSSYRHEAGLEEDNERLEFIGDAVLQLIVTERLLKRFPKAAEGELTQKRSALVCEETLFEIEEKIGLLEFLRIGKGMEKQKNRGNRSIGADALEALIGAIYADSGLPEARAFFERFFSTAERLAFESKTHNPKSALQETLQALGKPLPEYFLLEKTGQDDAPLFLVGVRSGSEILSTGTGHSKKEAEFSAARSALDLLRQIQPVAFI